MGEVLSRSIPLLSLPSFLLLVLDLCDSPQERKRNEDMKLAIEKAASIEKAMCANCSQEFIVQVFALVLLPPSFLTRDRTTTLGTASVCLTPTAWPRFSRISSLPCLILNQVHVEGYLWHAGAELTNWVKLRRRRDEESAAEALTWSTGGHAALKMRFSERTRI